MGFGGKQLSAEGLSVGYGKKVVLSGATLEVKAGQVVTLVGPNGCGKSTLLKTLIHQLGPLSGTVYLGNLSMEGMGSMEIARNMSILMTGHVQPEFLTCREVVEMGRYPYTGRFGRLSKEDQDIVEESMRLVQVEGLSDAQFSRLSDGQKQRVLLARAVCQKPKILVLDEPTSYLDINYKMMLLATLKKLVKEQHLAVILSLHDLDLAEKISDHVLCIKDGKVDREGRPQDIFTGEYIAKLFDLEEGSFQPSSGSVEMGKVEGEPKVFVIGGTGSGIPVYRMLWRRQVPFAAGILFENDIDVPTACALSGHVILEEPFRPISRQAVEKAEKWIRSCEKVACPLESFGPYNEPCRRLREMARESRKLVTDLDEL